MKLLLSAVALGIGILSGVATAQDLVYRPQTDAATFVQVQHRHDAIRRAREDLDRARHRLHEAERRAAPHRVIEQRRRDVREAERRLHHLERAR